jgi:hypothetical protein
MMDDGHCTTNGYDGREEETMEISNRGGEGGV